MRLEEILLPYNPWWGNGALGPPPLPWFRRPVFDRILEAVLGPKQVVSIAGPRVVGKTTLVRQVISELLARGTDPRNILYFSMDDPLLLRDPYREGFFDLLADRIGRRPQPNATSYVFLDEVQRYSRWDLCPQLLRDQGSPLRLVVSGTTAPPTGWKSTVFHITPFSFREYVLYRSRRDGAVRRFVVRGSKHARAFREALVARWVDVARRATRLQPTPDVDERIKGHLLEYFVEGGFPGTWELPDLVLKQRYLFDHHVQKVVLEDLASATEFRQPENITSFYLSLVERPGQDLKLERASAELGISRPMLEKYFPLLEATGLVKRLPKFSPRTPKIRRGSMKCYLADLALRNAIQKSGRRVLDDPVAISQCAESAVFNVLSRWPAIETLGYYREKRREFEFVGTLGGRKHLAVDVKFRRSFEDLTGMLAFMRKYPESYGLIVGRARLQLLSPRSLTMPLHLFLLAFD